MYYFRSAKESGVDRLFRALPLLLFAAALARPVSATQHTVTVQDFSFSPANLTISHGDTVVWNCTNGFHNVHHLGNPSRFGTAAASAPWTYQFAFSDVGDSVFHYECQIHPSQMQGTVTVQPLAAPERPRRPSSAFSLSQNYPNPFNPVTDVRFDLAHDGAVRLDVFNLMGQRVAELVNAPLAAGSHTVSFDASALPTGVYIYRLAADGQTVQRKMMLLK
jgi:plastocyanin